MIKINRDLFIKIDGDGFSTYYADGSPRALKTIHKNEMRKIAKELDL